MNIIYMKDEELSLVSGAAAEVDVDRIGTTALVISIDSERISGFILVKQGEGASVNLVPENHGGW